MLELEWFIPNASPVDELVVSDASFRLEYQSRTWRTDENYEVHRERGTMRVSLHFIIIAEKLDSEMGDLQFSAQISVRIVAYVRTHTTWVNTQTSTGQTRTSPLAVAWRGSRKNYVNTTVDSWLKNILHCSEQHDSAGTQCRSNDYSRFCFCRQTSLKTEPKLKLFWNYVCY